MPVSRPCRKNLSLRVPTGLTPLGGSLCPVVAALHEWGAKHRETVQRLKAGRRGAR